MPSKIRGFQILNVTAKSADLFIYDVVGFDGNDATTVVKQIADLAVEQINVRINSPGGLVFDGFAIYNALNAHAAKIVVQIDGLAASIASVIAMAGDEINIAENAMMMIHLPSVFMGGTSEDLRKQADVLDQLTKTITDLYVARTGLKENEIVDMMKNETWLNATDAHAKGFATAITGKLKAAACAEWDPKQFNFKNVPADHRTFPVFPSSEEKPASPDLRFRRRRLTLAEL